MQNTKKDIPLVIYQKRADNANRIIIPKFFLEANGRDFYMEVYKDTIILIPVKKEEE